MTTDRDNYGKIYKVIDLINRLSSTMEGLTHEDLEEAFGWKKRTRERMIEMISLMYPTAFERWQDDERRARFRLERQAVMPENHITERDFSALQTAIDKVEGQEAVSRPLSALYAKLAKMGEVSHARELDIEDLTKVNGIAARPRPHIKLNAKIVDKLQEAILSFHKVKIEYTRVDGTTKTAETCPLGFLYGDENSYLIAAHEFHIATPIHYILSQISNVRVLPATFDAGDFNIRTFASRSFGVWRSEDKPYKVKWLVSKGAADRARLFQFHPTQRITENPDGTLLVEFEADGLKEMAWHLVQWGGEIKILMPKELKDEYKSVLDAAAGAIG